MPIIKLKFSPEMEEMILQGKKCCTTRDEQKGEIGDVFRLKGDRLYRIVDIIEIEYECIDEYYKMDGFDSVDDYLDVIDKVYPSLAPEDLVYIHFFQYLDSGCRDFGYSGQCISKEICKVGEYCSKKKWTGGL